jgi:hypothetical protein
MAKWYVVVSGATHELGWDELKQWAAMGRLKPTDPARSETETDWRTVGQVPELVRLMPPQPVSPGAGSFQPPQPVWANPAQPSGWTPPPPPPKSSRGLAIGIIVGSLLLVVIGIGVVAVFVVQLEKRNRRGTNVIAEKGNATVLTATDRSCQITLPVGWESVSGLNKDAVLQALNRREDLYLIIIQEEIPEGAEIDLERGSEAMTANFRKMYTDAKLGGPVPITVNGRQAISRDISYTESGVKLRGVHVLTATETRAFQLFMWSSESGFARNNQFLREMPTTFRPIQGDELDPKMPGLTVEVTGDGGKRVGGYRFLNESRPISLDSTVKTLDKTAGVETVTVPKASLPLDLTVNGRKFRLTEARLLEAGCQWNAEGETTVPVFLSTSSGMVPKPPVNSKTRTKK